MQEVHKINTDGRPHGGVASAHRKRGASTMRAWTSLEALLVIGVLGAGGIAQAQDTVKIGFSIPMTGAVLRERQADGGGGQAVRRARTAHHRRGPQGRADLLATTPGCRTRRSASPRNSWSTTRSPGAHRRLQPNAARARGGADRHRGEGAAGGDGRLDPRSSPTARPTSCAPSRPSRRSRCRWRNGRPRTASSASSPWCRITRRASPRPRRRS